MTWEETIQFIRKESEYSDLVKNAYFDENLELNVSRFKSSLEYKETLKLIETYAPHAKTILDIGCGNGISVINFAQQGYQVTAVEPDPSDTVGAGAIKILKDKLNLENVDLHIDFAENINFSNDSFDVIYIRQAMHHANNLNKFIKECVRVLKPNGLLLTIRDHVIFDDKDKEWFLKAHPLHKFYGGENAYKPEQYRYAIKKAGATIVKELKYYDSVMNYFPQTEQELNALKMERLNTRKQKFKRKLGMVSKLPFLWEIYLKVSGYKSLNEEFIPGRMYSYVAIKK